MRKLLSVRTTMNRLCGISRLCDAPSLDGDPTEQYLVSLYFTIVTLTTLGCGSALFPTSTFASQIHK
jgi:hypothetical protein